MQTTSSNPKRLFAAFLLALVIAGVAGQASALAYEGYGTGNCSLWQHYRAWRTGVYCGYL